MELNNIAKNVKQNNPTIDCNAMCRLCMAKNAKVPIFPEKNVLKIETGLPLVCKIIAGANIQIGRDDGLPMHICLDCASKVESTYDFLRLCEASDSFLRQYLDFGLNMILTWSELFGMIRGTNQYSSDEQ